jgi:hypothetical protein
MDEIIFLVEDAPEGGYSARALGHAIFTAAETEQELQGMVERLRLIGQFVTPLGDMEY